MVQENENCDTLKDQSSDSTVCSSPSRVVTGDPIPIGEYILHELETRGWTAEDAAYSFAPNGKRDEWHCWLELLTCVEIWQGHDIKFGEEEAERLESIFGVSKETWLNLHSDYEAQRKANRN